MGETGSITCGWKKEVSCTRERFCVLGLGKPRPRTQNHSLVQDTSSFHPLVMEPLYLLNYSQITDPSIHLYYHVKRTLKEIYGDRQILGTIKWLLIALPI